jgi:hypothetical protein
VTERGSSTYATGGGGVSFAQRVATVYLASMLTGDRRAEASELPVRRVSFQTGPAHPVDDLLVECGDETAEVTLAVACRATPNFVQSNDETVKLVGSLLAQVEKFDTDSLQVAVATAGWSNQWKLLATMCDIARAHADPESFQASIDVDARWSKPVCDRHKQFLKMVEKAVEDGSSTDDVLRLAWRLLGRLHILELRTRHAGSLWTPCSAGTPGWPAPVGGKESRDFPASPVCVTLCTCPSTVEILVPISRDVLVGAALVRGSRSSESATRG